MIEKQKDGPCMQYEMNCVNLVISLNYVLSLLNLVFSTVSGEGLFPGSHLVSFHYVLTYEKDLALPPLSLEREGILDFYAI
jgi:hypothetical protein